MRRKTLKQPPGVPNYKASPVFDIGGAHTLIFQREFVDPLENITGTGSVPLRTFRVTSPQLYIMPNVFRAGIATQHGNIVFSPLTDGSI